jgi:hypothetical protein
MLRSAVFVALAATLPLRECRPDPVREAQRRGDPCAFLTREEAELVVGARDVTEEREDNGLYAVCRYRGPAAEGRVVELRLFIDGRVAEKQGIDAYVESLPPRPREFVSGLGGEALWAGDALFVRRGHRFFVLRLTNVDSDPPWEWPRALARLVARDFDQMDAVAAPTPAPE